MDACALIVASQFEIQIDKDLVINLFNSWFICFYTYNKKRLTWFQKKYFKNISNASTYLNRLQMYILISILGLLDLLTPVFYFLLKYSLICKHINPFDCYINFIFKVSYGQLIYF